MYRPLKFSEVIGQELSVQLIKNGLKNNRLPRAIIFYGSSGTGKTTLARLVSAWSFCLNKNQDLNDVCGECDMCKGVQSGSIPDLLEFDAASHTSIEDIREILDLCNYVPQLGMEKIFIIDEAHMLSRNAIAALLKTLEEAKEGVRFILATTEIDKISSAIRSRCFCVPLQDLTKDNIENCLFSSAKKDNIEIDHDSVHLISQVSYGSMREALSVFYRAAMLSSKITIDILKKLLFYVEDSDLCKIAEYMQSGKSVELYDFLLLLFKNQNIFGVSLVRQLLEYFKLLYLNADNKAQILKIIIDLNKLHQEVMKTSFFNEITIINLAEIAYELNNC